MDDKLKINIINKAIIISELKYAYKQIAKENKEYGINQLISDDYWEEFYFNRIIRLEKELKEINDILCQKKNTT